jgi:hypothetical protein
VDRTALSDLLTIADALEHAPDDFVIRRTLRRIASAELDAAAAAAVLRAHDSRWGAEALADREGERLVDALAVGRLFDR